MSSGDQTFYEMALSHVKKCSLTIYNLTQAQGWFALLIMILMKILNNPYDTFWNARTELKNEIQIYQVL